MSAAPGLRRSLDRRDLIAYGLAYIAPIAPFSTLGFVWQASHGLIVLAYVLGGACMYFTAKSYALMTERVPSAGSVYGFARDALGPFPGFVAGWMILLDYLLIPAFVFLLMAVALGELVPGVDRGVWLVLLVGAALAVNWFGVTVTTRASLYAVALQVLLILGFLALAGFALAAGKGNGALTLKPLYDARAFDLHGVFTATSICIMSFLGFDAISTLSEEVAGDDRRVVGRAIMAVLLLAAAFFVGTTWVLGNLLPGLVIKDPATAIYELATWSVGGWASLVLAWAMASVVGISNVLPMQVGVARVVFAMGRDGQLPRILGRVHPRYATPHVAMLATAAVSLAVSLAMKDRLDELASIVNFGALSGFLLLHVSVLAKFARGERSRAWFAHWASPLAGIGVVVAVFSGMRGLAVTVGLGWLATGVGYGLVLRALRREHLDAAL